MTRWWCEVAWLGGDTVTEQVLITVADDRITTVESGVDAPTDATRLRGLTLPGIANGHSHCFHRALRGRTHSGKGTGTFWTWREQMYRAAEAIDPDQYLELATATFAEMALAGYTAVGEFHYLHHAAKGRHYNDPNEMGRRLVAAAKYAGIRITLLDTCYLSGGLDRSGSLPLSDVQARFADADVDAWATRVDALQSRWENDAHARIGAAIHSVRAVDPEQAAVVASYADVLSIPLHAHVSEQPAENDACLAVHGRTPTGLLESAGALEVSGGFTAVHATHLTEDDIGAYGRTHSTCCFCPTTERDLADGTGPAVALRQRGARLSIGSDSNAIIDPFEEARAVELNERMRSLRRGNLSVRALATAATSDGMASIGWADSGRLAPSFLADFVTVDLDDRSLTGIGASDALAAVIHAGSARAVHNVVVAGVAIVRDGVHELIPDHARRLGAAIRTLSS